MDCRPCWLYFKTAVTMAIRSILYVLQTCHQREDLKVNSNKVIFLPFESTDSIRFKAFCRILISFLIDKILHFVWNKIFMHFAILDIRIWELSALLTILSYACAFYFSPSNEQFFNGDTRWFRITIIDLLCFETFQNSWSTSNKVMRRPGNNSCFVSLLVLLVMH